MTKSLRSQQQQQPLKAHRFRAVFSLCVSKMSPLCECCSEHMNKLNQQVSVMRKEIKNLRYVCRFCTATCFSHERLLAVLRIKQIKRRVLFCIGLFIFIIFQGSHYYYTLILNIFSNRQTLDSAIRAHRKQLLAVQAAVSKIGLSEEVKAPAPTPPSPPSPAALERGSYHQRHKHL